MRSLMSLHKIRELWLYLLWVSRPWLRCSHHNVHSRSYAIAEEYENREVVFFRNTLTAGAPHLTAASSSSNCWQYCSLGHAAVPPKASRLQLEDSTNTYGYVRLLLSCRHTMHC
jgi:hypothetical protein